jgi:hypothetical protein
VDLSTLLDPVKDNIVVQWCLIAAVLLTVGTNTATKLKGPIGGLARAAQKLGQRRVNREAAERRKARQQMLQRATEGRAFADQEIESLHNQLDEALDERDALARLIREHMGWDFDRVQDLINRGVRPGDIPTPPPLRVPWGTPSRTDTRALPLPSRKRADTDENPAVVRASE